MNETNSDFVGTNMLKNVMLVVERRAMWWEAERDVRWRGGRKERGCSSEAPWAVGCTVGQQLRHRVA